MIFNFFIIIIKAELIFDIVDKPSSSETSNDGGVILTDLMIFGGAWDQSKKSIVKSE